MTPPTVLVSSQLTQSRHALTDVTGVVSWKTLGPIRLTRSTISDIKLPNPCLSHRTISGGQNSLCVIGTQVSFWHRDDACGVSGTPLVKQCQPQLMKATFLEFDKMKRMVSQFKRLDIQISNSKISPGQAIEDWSQV